MTQVKLEVGKYYRTRDGRKFGPVYKNDNARTNASYPFKVPQSFVTYRKNGTHIYWGAEHIHDLIAEWQDGPVSAATVKKIEPGAYGRVWVGGKFTSKVSLEFLGNTLFTADELRATAATLTEIADALEGKC